jgi:hypothetical protein
MVKFNQYNVQLGNVKVKVSYFQNSNLEIVIYAKDYGYELKDVLPDLTYNGSEVMIDYFEKSRAVIPVGHPLYSAAYDRYLVNQIKQDQKRAARRVA